MNNWAVVQKNNKFIVTKNGEPIVLPKSNDRQAVVTQFDCKEDAEKYIGILNKLSKQKKYQKS